MELENINMSNMHKYDLVYERILPRYIWEERYDQKKLSDGQFLLGTLGSEGGIEPILHVALAAPFCSALITGAFLLINESFFKLSMNFSFLGIIDLDWMLYVLIWLILAHYLLKNCLKNMARKNAYVYFEEGVHAAFRQLYLAKTKLHEADFEIVLSKRLEHERRMDQMMSILEEQNSKEK